ncbi:MAG: hypothetical protein WCI89_02300 [bacterium]
MAIAPVSSHSRTSFKAWSIRVGVIGTGVALAALVTYLIARPSSDQKSAGVQNQQNTYNPQQQQAVPTNTSQKCPGELQVVEVSAIKVVINPGKRCVVKFGVEAGGSRVELLDTNDSVIMTVGPEPTNTNRFFEAIRAVSGGKATFHYKLTSS